MLLAGGAVLWVLGCVVEVEANIEFHTTCSECVRRPRNQAIESPPCVLRPRYCSNQHFSPRKQAQHNAVDGTPLSHRGYGRRYSHMPVGQVVKTPT